MANSCAEFRKNFRFSSIFFKIHNFGTHIFLYVYTTHTQLPHMSYSGSQIHNTCYTHVKSCVYMCCVQGSTLDYSISTAAKPVSYSVSKFGLLGLTKYLATYWADQNIRVNALSPAGVYVNQDEDFVDKITSLIPMSRMASPDEYKGAVIFLCSDASKYMTGANLIIDGGRSIW